MLKKVKYLAYFLALAGGALFGCGCVPLCGIPKPCELFRLGYLALNEDIFG